MSDLLLITSALEPSAEVLPALGLLLHPVRVLPADASALVEAPPADWTLQRRQEYLNWTEQVVAGCRGCNAALEAFYDEVLKEGRRILQM